MANSALANVKIKAKEYELLGRVLESVVSDYNNLFTVYKQTEEMEQKTRWDNEQSRLVPVWEDEDETIPCMIHKWDYVPISIEDMDDEDKCRVKAYEHLISKLEKLA